MHKLNLSFNELVIYEFKTVTKFKLCMLKILIYS